MTTAIEGMSSMRPWKLEMHEAFIVGYIPIIVNVYFCWGCLPVVMVMQAIGHYHNGSIAHQHLGHCARITVAAPAGTLQDPHYSPVARGQAPEIVVVLLRQPQTR